jgi:hypothetical protein
MLPSWLFWWRPPALLRRVIVNFRSSENEAMEGVLVRSRGPWLILADASALKAGQPPMKLPGDIHIPRDDVKFLQVLS